MIEPIVIVVIAVTCTAWFVTHLWRRRMLRRAMQPVSGLQILERRYANGEIGREEYLQKKIDIVGVPQPTA